MSVTIDCAGCGTPIGVETPPQDLFVADAGTEHGPSVGSVLVAGGRLLCAAVCEKCQTHHVVRVAVHVLKGDSPESQAGYTAGIPNRAGPLAKLGGLFDAVLNKDDNALAQFAYNAVREEIDTDENRKAAEELLREIQEKRDQGDDDDPDDNDPYPPRLISERIARRRRIMKHLGPEGHDVLMPDDDDDDRDPKRKPN